MTNMLRNLLFILLILSFVHCSNYGDKVTIEHINFFYKNEIEEEHSIIRKINEGLSTSKIGIIVITPNFIGKHFTNWELECLVYLMIYNKIRLIPLMKNINREQIIEKYPLMNPLFLKKFLRNVTKN